MRVNTGFHPGRLMLAAAGVCAAGVCAGVLLVAPPAAVAQSCQGTLVPAGTTTDATYSFTCDFALSQYTIAVEAPDGISPGTVQDAGQGFTCVKKAIDDPDSDDEGGEYDDSGTAAWTCSGSAPANTALQGSFSASRGGNLCDPPLALTITVGQEARLRLPINCKSSTGTTTDPGSGGGGTTTNPTPKLTALRMTPWSFRAASSGASIKAAVTGTTVRYTLSVAARTTFSIEQALPGIRSAGRCVPQTKQNRHGTHCTRYVVLKGTFVHAGAKGANAFRFTGRLAGKKLTAGNYRLVAVARTSAGKASTIVRSGAFHIMK